MERKGKNEFESAYWPEKTQHLIEVLSNRGTLLDDECILHLFNLMAWKKDYSDRDVRMVDSALVELMMKSSGDDKRLHCSRVADRFRNAPPPLILLPLVDGAHWSLLAYRTHSQQWYHFDSAKQYHRELARSTLAALRAAGCTPLNATVHRLRNVPQQEGGWECGLYVLQYCLMLSESSKDAGEEDEQTFINYMDQYLESIWDQERRYASNENLLLFTQSVLSLLYTLPNPTATGLIR
jgi:hypothetical protein